MRLAILLCLTALTLSAFGCAEANKNAGPDLTRAQQARSGRQADGSLVSIATASDGTKTETREFESGEVTKVTRTTYPDNTQRAIVEYRDGRTVQLQDDKDIASLMEDSADHIKAAASKAWAATKELGEEMADKAADKTKDGLKKAKDAAGDAAEAAGQGIKKAGKEIKKAGEKVKDKVPQ